MTPRFSRTIILIAVFAALSNALVSEVQAEALASNPPTLPAAGDGYAMMSWLGSLGVVEQLQAVHRFSQGEDPQALRGLLAAINSGVPLARRKASRSLLEKVRIADPSDRKMIAEELRSDLENTDPIVQQNVVRLMAALNTPESQAALRQLFITGNKQSQLSAVEALVVGESQHQQQLNLARQLSPFADVRRAASDSLK